MVPFQSSAPSPGNRQTVCPGLWGGAAHALPLLLDVFSSISFGAVSMLLAAVYAHP